MSSSATLTDLYTILITTIVPGPASWSYFIPQLILPLGLLIPPSALSHTQLSALVVPISLAATLHAWHAMHGTDVLSMDCVYMTLFHYVFRDPRREFRRVVRRDDDVSIQLQAYPKHLPTRLKWVGSLILSRPLNDWLIGSTTHDRRVLQPRQTSSRAAFARDILARLLPVLLIFLPLSYRLAASDPYFRSPSSPLSLFSPSPHPPTSPLLTHLHTSIPPFILRPLTILAYTYSLLLTLFLPALLLPLPTNALLALPPDAYSPHTMRPHFGPTAAVLDRGLAGFWGAFWHQQMRHIVSEPGRAVANRMRLPARSTQRYALLVVSAFLLSGVTHMGLVPRAPGGVEGRANALRLRVALFFWVQPLGIAVEGGVVEPVLRRVGSRVVRRGARVVWVLAWLGAACLFLVRPFEELGYWGAGRVWVGLVGMW